MQPSADSVRSAASLHYHKTKRKKGSYWGKRFNQKYASSYAFDENMIVYIRNDETILFLSRIMNIFKLL